MNRLFQNRFVSAAHTSKRCRWSRKMDLLILTLCVPFKIYCIWRWSSNDNFMFKVKHLTLIMCRETENWTSFFTVLFSSSRLWIVNLLTRYLPHCCRKVRLTTFSFMLETRLKIYQSKGCPILFSYTIMLNSKQPLISF